MKRVGEEAAPSFRASAPVHHHQQQQHQQQRRQSAGSGSRAAHAPTIIDALPPCPIRTSPTSVALALLNNKGRPSTIEQTRVFTPLHIAVLQSHGAEVRLLRQRVCVCVCVCVCAQILVLACCSVQSTHLTLLCACGTVPQLVSLFALIPARRLLEITARLAPWRLMRWIASQAQRCITP